MLPCPTASAGADRQDRCVKHLTISHSISAECHGRSGTSAHMTQYLLGDLDPELSCMHADGVPAPADVGCGMGPWGGHQRITIYSYSCVSREVK